MSPKDSKRHRRTATARGRSAASHANGVAWGERARSQAVRVGRFDDANAFMPDPGSGPARIHDDLAESLAEEFIQAATRGSDDDEALDGLVPEELGGPFVETSAAEEFANDTDDMNPPDAEPEPLPRPVAGLVQNPRETEDDED